MAISTPSLQVHCMRLQALLNSTSEWQRSFAQVAQKPAVLGKALRYDTSR
jgi:hypothetical protein